MRLRGLLPRKVRSGLKALMRRTGYRLVKESPGLWTAPAVRMTRGWANRLRAEAPIRTIFDVGANYGQTVRRMRERFPKATIYSFEPFDPSFQRLRDNVGDDPRVHLFNFALGEASRSATYNANASPGTGSLLDTSPTVETFTTMPEKYASTGQTEVRVERLDDFCQEHDIEVIDILKVDTQGYEKQILEGAGDMLRPDRIRGLYLEMLFVDMYRGQAWPDEIMGLLRERGYRMYGIASVNFSFEHGWHWADGVFVGSETEPVPSSAASDHPGAADLPSDRRSEP